MTRHVPIKQPHRRSAWIAALATALVLSAPGAVLAGDEDGCDKAPEELYATCKLIINLEKFSEAAAAKERWEDSRDYSSAAVHAIDYLLRKVGDAPAQAPLREQMSARRAALEARRKEIDAKSKRHDGELAATKEERRDGVLVNLHFPERSPDVYVNGTKATGPVHVPRGPVVLGIGQDGGRYDVGTLPEVRDKVEVQVAGLPQAPAKRGAGKGAAPAGAAARGLAFDFSAAPIFGARVKSWDTFRWSGMGGVRGEVTFPRVTIGETLLFLGEAFRLRPTLQYSVERAIDPGNNWTVHGLGCGLKLSVNRSVDFDLGLTGGIQYRDGNSYWGGYVPELSFGLSYPILEPSNTAGWKLNLGVSGAAGVSFWERSRGEVVASPYAHGGLFLRLHLETRQQGSPAPPPPAPPASAMVHFKGGPFPVGSDSGGPSERPEHIVLLLSFDLDVREVTVSDYRACVGAGKCSPPTDAPGCNWNAGGRERHPVNCVTRRQADDYCGFVGKRLPTESEWEHAARGALHRKYPWGAQAPATQPCWSGGGERRTSTCEVGSHREDRTPDGVLDLAGNVSEWTGPYCDYLSTTCGSKGWVSRGGSFGSNDAFELRSVARSAPRDAALDTVGFRCAR